jgi:hypothetical protein
MPTQCQRVAFACKDGEDIFNLKHCKVIHRLYEAWQFVETDDTQTCYITTTQMEKAFGPGESRPAEEENPVITWRFKNGNTFLRVTTPVDPEKPGRGSDILVECPDGIQDLPVDPKVDITDFIQKLFADIDQAVTAPADR